MRVIFGSSDLLGETKELEEKKKKKKGDKRGRVGKRKEGKKIIFQNNLKNNIYFKLVT
jgi:hypothetical protein